MKLEHHEIGCRKWCETWVCLKEKLLRRVSLQDIEVRGIGFIGKHFLISLYISKVTREVKRMDQRPNQPMFLMRNVTWRPGAMSMEQDYEMLRRAFLSGVPHPRRAWWQIPAPDGQWGWWGWRWGWWEVGGWAMVPPDFCSLVIDYHGNSTTGGASEPDLILISLWFILR